MSSTMMSMTLGRSAAPTARQPKAKISERKSVLLAFLMKGSFTVSGPGQDVRLFCPSAGIGGVFGDQFPVAFPDRGMECIKRNCFMSLRLMVRPCQGNGESLKDFHGEE